MERTEVRCNRYHLRLIHDLCEAHAGGAAAAQRRNTREAEPPLLTAVEEISELLWRPYDVQDEPALLAHREEHQIDCVPCSSSYSSPGSFSPSGSTGAMGCVLPFLCEG